MQTFPGKHRDSHASTIGGHRHDRKNAFLMAERWQRTAYNKALFAVDNTLTARRTEIGQRFQSCTKLFVKGEVMDRYTLPDLPYDYSALEPHISGKIMELHHGKHHAGYVKNANAVLEQLEQARDKEDFTRLASLERSLAFNLSGHILHSIFWKNMMAKGGGRPAGDFNAAIERDFSNFDRFRRQFTEVASSIMGSGWAALVWEPIGNRLLITQIYDHQSNLAQAGVPLMVLDAWEHAYYLQYQNRKTEFFEAVWNLWNWQDIAARYASALELDIDVGKVA
jgi:Fe-Mn family superoxide dismutase